jgi:hypothetical protein
MKRVLLTALLALGCVSAAQAQRPCYPGTVVNVGPAQSLSPAQLSSWLATYGVPAGVSDPHAYVAFHATDQRCKALYGSGSWAQITGPYSLTNMVNSYNISQGVTFQCKKCSGGVIGVPIDEKAR